jgi:hypothetical protein
MCSPLRLVLGVTGQRVLRLRASLVYFAMVLGAGFVLGMFRVPLLVPRLGERTARVARNARHAGRDRDRG